MSKREANRLLDKIDEIVFEGAVCREWIVDLRDRADKLIAKAATNSVFETDEEIAEQLAELKEARDALHRASAELRMLQLAVERRENIT